LEAANSHPSQALHFMKSLAKDVEVITNNLELIEEKLSQYYKDDSREDEIVKILF
jgi:hypothetical protein